MRILLTIEYDGKDFFGWQIQPNKRTVQGELTFVLTELLGENITLHASGRTDTGVHALGQKAHFDYSGNFPIDKLPYALNTKLPEDISILNAVVVPETFEAQYSAKRKTYRYNFYFSRIPHPLLRSQAVRVNYPIEKFREELAKQGLEKIIGVHDFTAFSSTGRPVKSGVRTIYNATLEKQGEVYSIVITGNGFLYNMVRILAGTIVEIGLGIIPLENIAKALETQDRTLCGTTFPPEGLVLENVEYPENLQ